MSPPRQTQIRDVSAPNVRPTVQAHPPSPLSKTWSLACSPPSGQPDSHTKTLPDKYSMESMLPRQRKRPSNEPTLTLHRGRPPSKRRRLSGLHVLEGVEDIRKSYQEVSRGASNRHWVPLQKASSYCTMNIQRTPSTSQLSSGGPARESPDKTPPPSGEQDRTRQHPG